MDKLLLRMNKKSIDEESENKIIDGFLPDMIEICSNPIRAGIMHVLVTSSSTGHSLKVEDIAFKLGTYHSIVLHHLERLRKWELVEIKRMKNYGKRTKRSIWGLNLNYPNWIFEVYTAIKSGFGETDLKKISSRNTSMRSGEGTPEKNARREKRFKYFLS